MLLGPIFDLANLIEVNWRAIIQLRGGQRKVLVHQQYYYRERNAQILSVDGSCDIIAAKLDMKTRQDENMK